MVKSLLSIALISGAVFFAGCSNNLARFSLASTGLLPVKMEKGGDIVTGKDCRTYILFWGIGNANNRVSGAVADALNVAAKKGEPSDALQNVDISYSSWSAFFFGRDCFIAKGQPVTVKH